MTRFVTIGCFLPYLSINHLVSVLNQFLLANILSASILSTIFISFIITGVLSITSVLPVMLSIRDMYYRHKAAGMLNSRSVGRALASAEWRFIVISPFLFCLMFIPISGIANDPSVSMGTKALESVAFWGFFTFNGAIYSYIGEASFIIVDLLFSACILLSVFIHASSWYRSTLHVLGSRFRYSYGFNQHFYWNQQLLFGFDCTSSTNE